MKGLTEGDVIWWRPSGPSGSGGGQQPGPVQYGRIAGLRRGEHSGDSEWHVQRLSTSLHLPKGTFPIYGAPAPAQGPLPLLPSVAYHPS